MAARQAYDAADFVPGEPRVDVPAREMDRVVDAEAGLQQLLDPSFGIIVDPDIFAVQTAEARMVEKRKMVEAKLSRGIGKELAQLRQLGAGCGLVAEAIDQPPQRQPSRAKRQSRSRTISLRAVAREEAG